MIIATEFIWHVDLYDEAKVLINHRNRKDCVKYIWN